MTAAAMRLGVDFDNTLVSYDRLFHRCARERGLIPAECPATKQAVRAYLWGQPDGNTPWTELQGVVYGERMAEAEPCPGVVDFLRACRRRGVPVTVISHKMVYPALGPRVDLRAAARAWLAAQGFFAADGAGLAPDRVFFEATRADKLARIERAACTHFVDDLPEIFAEPGFPAGVQRLLYAPAGAGAPPGVRVFRHWRELDDPGFFQSAGTDA